MAKSKKSPRKVVKGTEPKVTRNRNGSHKGTLYAHKDGKKGGSFKLCLADGTKKGAVKGRVSENADGTWSATLGRRKLTTPKGRSFQTARRAKEAVRAAGGFRAPRGQN